MLSDITGCPQSFSLLDFDKYIVHSADNKDELISLIKQGQVDKIKCRFNVWRLCLGVLDFDSSWQDKVNQLQQHRKLFEELELKHIPKLQTKKSLPVESAPVVASKNPLAQKIVPKTSAPTNAPDDKFLHEQILKDVQRTYQERDFFTNPHISNLLTKVLFIWSKENPDISYVQGINEIGASVIYVYFTSAVELDKKYQEYEGVVEEVKEKNMFANGRQYAEADIYAVFTKLMETGHKDMFRLESEAKANRNPKSTINTPILERITKLNDVTLKHIDLELFRHIKLLDMQMRSFLLRWIRCMHTREFELEDSFVIWDSIFLDYYLSGSKNVGLHFIDCSCLAMLVYLRDIALTKEKGYELLQLYQKYPKVQGQFLRDLIKLAWNVQEVLEKPPTHEGDLEKKRKQLYNMEKGFTEQVRKQEMEQKKNAPIIKAVDLSEKEVDQEINPIFYKKQEPKKEEPKKEEPKKEVPKAEPTKIEQPKVQPTKIEQPKPEPVKESPPKPAPPKPEPKKPEFQLTLSQKQWKQIESLLKKSIQQNTDIESKALSIKALKMLQTKEQEEIKKYNQSISYDSTS